MSNGIVENLLEQIKGLAVAERNKFSSYKSRNLRQQLSDAEAVVNAAARLGIFPTIQQENQALLETVGSVLEQGGKVLSFNRSHGVQGTGMFVSNSNPTASNTAPTGGEISDEQLQVEGVKDYASPTAIQQPPTPLLNNEARAQTETDWTQIARIVIYGAAFFIGTSALIYLSAEAAGGDGWAYFWAILSEGVGAAFLIHPARGWNKAGLWAIGILCIFLGFSTMLTGVFKKSDSDLTQTVSSNANVKDIEEQIGLRKRSIAAAESLRDGLPGSWVSKKREAQKSIDEKSGELSELYASLKTTRGGAAQNISANIIGLWTGVEGFRRFLLLLVNIVAGHAFVKSLILAEPKRRI